MKITLDEVTVEKVLFDWNGGELVAIDDSTYSGSDAWAMLADAHPNAKRVGLINPEDSQEQWFAVWSADCFDPPVNVVRADDMAEAIDIAVDAVKGLQVTAEDRGETDAEWQASIESGIVGMTGDGLTYDSETLDCAEVSLKRVFVR